MRKEKRSERISRVLYWCAQLFGRSAVFEWNLQALRAHSNAGRIPYTHVDGIRVGLRKAVEYERLLFGRAPETKITRFPFGLCRRPCVRRLLLFSFFFSASFAKRKFPNYKSRRKFIIVRFPPTLWVFVRSFRFLAFFLPNSANLLEAATKRNGKRNSHTVCRCVNCTRHCGNDGRTASWRQHTHTRGARRGK